MGWKIFAVVNALMVVVFMVYTFTHVDIFEEFGFFWQAVGLFGTLIMGPLSMIGLLAYAFNLTLFGAGFWTPFAYVNTVWVGGAFLHTTYQAVLKLADNWSIANLLGMLIGTLLGVAYLYFSWLGVWRYALRRAQQAA